VHSIDPALPEQHSETFPGMKLSLIKKQFFGADIKIVQN